ncbi:hypothetical protein STEG23_036498, partial [Scotinomys teguina]
GLWMLRVVYSVSTSSPVTLLPVGAGKDLTGKLRQPVLSEEQDSCSVSGEKRANFHRPCCQRPQKGSDNGSLHDPYGYITSSSTQLCHFLSACTDLQTPTGQLVLEFKSCATTPGCFQCGLEHTEIQIDFLPAKIELKACATIA